MNRTQRVLAVAATALLLACQTQSDSAPSDEQAIATVRARLVELEAQLGPDAYGQPEIEQHIRTLHRIPESSAHFKDARRLLEELRARYRLAREAREGPPEGARPKVPSYGRVQMDGPAPEEPAEVEAAETIEVGASREALVGHYGKCLVRQTWFRGRNGGPTTELFHVAPECRAQLQPRIFRVADSRIVGIEPGNLDDLLANPTQAAEERRNSTVQLPPPPTP